MIDKRFSRRYFLKAAGAVTAMAAMGEMPENLFSSGSRMAKFPGKTDLILLTSRPPQLETPIHYFRHLITPNEAVFVRWHISGIPTSVDLNQWRLTVSGNTEKELKLSTDDVRKFEKKFRTLR